MQKVEVPVLMYHEIHPANYEWPASHKMTPSYNISCLAFEEQMNYLAEIGYIGITFKDLERIDKNNEKRHIILTFDDGWIGNYDLALPVLKKYNFKAVFFVSGDFVGKPGFMTWKHLGKLVDSGMLVQPHGMSHRPLQNLEPENLYWELSESKKLIEQKLGISVFSMSFPHGSYNGKVLEMAYELRYKIFCSSDLKKVYAEDLIAYPSTIGRIPITHNMKLDKFTKFVNYHSITYTKYQLFKNIKNIIRRTIGIENYRKLYRAYYTIDDPDDRK